MHKYVEGSLLYIHCDDWHADRSIAYCRASTSVDGGSVLAVIVWLRQLISQVELMHGSAKLAGDQSLEASDIVSHLANYILQYCIAYSECFDSCRKRDRQTAPSAMIIIGCITRSGVSTSDTL